METSSSALMTQQVAMIPTHWIVSIGSIIINWQNTKTFLNRLLRKRRRWYKSTNLFKNTCTCIYIQCMEDFHSWYTMKNHCFLLLSFIWTWIWHFVLHWSENVIRHHLHLFAKYQMSSGPQVLSYVKSYVMATKIRSLWLKFFKCQSSWSFSLCASPAYMVKLGALQLWICTGATHTEGIM